MIRPILAASVATLILATPALAETRDYDVSSFTAIDVSAGIDVSFETGQSQSVSVENSKGDFGDIIVEVRGDTLVLKRPNRGLSWAKRERYSVAVSAPTLSVLDVSSGADAIGSGLSGREVSISTSSGADANVVDIVAENVSLSSSSGSDLKASGTCDHVEADSSSGSDIEARELICKSADADASSGSDIEIYASERVDADASSGADVDVFGGPTQTQIDKSSGGSVSISG